MSYTIIFWLLILLGTIFFIPWEIKKKYHIKVLLLGIILAFIFLIPQVLQIFRWFAHPFKKNFTNISINEPNENFWNEPFLIGILLIIYDTLIVLFSNGAWGERNERNKPNADYRFLFGQCPNCRKKVSRVATICPYCKSDLAN